MVENGGQSTKQLYNLNKINKSKRLMVGIPEGTEIHRLLVESTQGKNGNTPSHWEILNLLAIQIPKTRADRANDIITKAIDELSFLYPESKPCWPLIRGYICNQILGIECGDNGYVETKKKKLSDELFEELKKL